MCRRVQCEACQKPTYVGCGRHVEQVLGNVADTERCHCRQLASVLSNSSNALQSEVTSLYSASP
jgi:hypothetical protein